MQAKAINDSFVGSPPNVAKYGSPRTQIDLVIGKVYEIYAVASYQDVLFFQYVGELDVISWLPAWFFAVTDTSIPPDWICNVLDGTVGVTLVMGPDFVASSSEAYRSMVELEPDPVRRFNARLV